MLIFLFFVIHQASNPVRDWNMGYMFQFSLCDSSVRIFKPFVVVPHVHTTEANLKSG